MRTKLTVALLCVLLGGCATYDGGYAYRDGYYSGNYYSGNYYYRNNDRDRYWRGDRDDRYYRGGYYRDYDYGRYNRDNDYYYRSRPDYRGGVYFGWDRDR